MCHSSWRSLENSSFAGTREVQRQCRTTHGISRIQVRASGETNFGTPPRKRVRRCWLRRHPQSPACAETWTEPCTGSRTWLLFRWRWGASLACSGSFGSFELRNSGRRPCFMYRKNRPRMQQRWWHSPGDTQRCSTGQPARKTPLSSLRPALWEPLTPATTSNGRQMQETTKPLSTQRHDPDQTSCDPPSLISFTAYSVSLLISSRVWSVASVGSRTAVCRQDPRNGVTAAARVMP
ncbi:hypothetical protein TGVEG_213960 [Toxoplasma gondii VEG]|uniref:Uncharacterized protein n=1 Tax=Toxoplasma gondii (strain ATCC 50861 / VEG) TaxID=432359 RepID=V4ZA32_TOXGV|nr:hypothetical protein TGVEG_213960 [Toxoplasma gondii VEG]